MSWSALPIELILRILTFFDPVELVNFRSVNGFFKSLIDGTTTIQYRISLFASGMEDGYPGDRTTSERLNLLKTYETSWRNIEWNEHNTVLSPWGGLWEFYGNVWAHSRGSDSFDFVQLPSRIRGIPMRQWTLKFDYTVRDFGMDPSQDLLVTIENFRHAPNLSRIQLRMLSTGEKHPLAGSTEAVEHTLKLTMSEVIRNRWSHSIRICGDYVGILFMEHHGIESRNELVVWCWKTAVRKLVVLSANLRSFAFLGDAYVLGSTLQPPALLVYSLKPRNADDTTPANAHFLRFFFETASQDASDILLASDPSPGWPSNANKLQVPFQIAGDERMIAMNLQFFDDRNDYLCETSLIPTKPLLRYIESLPNKEGGHDVNWGYYGPLFTESVPGHSRWDIWTCFVFGMRYIVPRIIYIRGKPMMIIRDFCAKRYLRASKEEHKKSNALYKALTAGPRRKPYLHSILKSVPLPESIEVLHNVKLMISEDGIVVLEEAGIQGHSRVHLLTF